MTAVTNLHCDASEDTAGLGSPRARVVGIMQTWHSDRQHPAAFSTVSAWSGDHGFAYILLRLNQLRNPLPQVDQPFSSAALYANKTSTPTHLAFCMVVATALLVACGDRGGLGVSRHGIAPTEAVWENL